MKLHVIGLLAILLSLSSCSIRKGRLQAGMPNVNSYKSFDNYVFKASENPYVFKEAEDMKIVGDTLIVTKGYFNNNNVKLNEFVKKNNTLAFTIMRNDSIIYEYYRDKYDVNATITSFSVAKSYVSALLGIAVNEGYVNLQDPISKYVTFPKKKQANFGNVTVEQVLNHVAGFKYPSITWTFYNKNHKNLLKKIKFRKEPGTFYRYDNGNTMLITLILEKATGRKFQDYFEDKIWQHLAPQSELKWTVDKKKNNNVKTFCCMNGTARDIGKIGLMYLHKGEFNGKQIVPKEWVERSTIYNLKDASAYDNEYFWFLGPKKYGYYYAAGLYGQYVIVYPEKNIVITRFAKKSFFFRFLWRDQLEQILDQL